MCNPSLCPYAWGALIFPILSRGPLFFCWVVFAYDTMSFLVWIYLFAQLFSSMQEVCILDYNLFYIWKCMSIITNPSLWVKSVLSFIKNPFYIEIWGRFEFLFSFKYFGSMMSFFVQNILLEVDVFEKISLLLQRIPFTLVAIYLLFNYIFLAYRIYASLAWIYKHCFCRECEVGYLQLQHKHSIDHYKHG